MAINEENLKDENLEETVAEESEAEAKEAEDAQETETAEAAETEAEDAQESEEDSKKKKRKEKKKDKKDAQIEELTDRVKRQMAEFDNFRKRTEKEKSQMFETGAKSIIEKILPVVDNFERGLAANSGRGKRKRLCRRYGKDLQTADDNAGRDRCYRYRGSRCRI